MIYGLHAAQAALDNSLRKVEKLIINQQSNNIRVQTVVDKAEQKGILIERLSQQAFNRKFPEINHQGVVGFVQKMREYIEADLTELLENITASARILILDGVTDPHNLGACLRTADAAGVHFVIIPKDNSASMTPVVSKVASGAAESVPLVRVTNLARAIKLLKSKGVWVYGAAGEANESLYSLDFNGSIAFVLGGEGKGLRHLTRTLCDGLFSLPMLGQVSSLNVSVATGICLYEVVRQKNQKKI